MAVVLLSGGAFVAIGLYLAWTLPKTFATDQELRRVNRALRVRSACNQTLVRAESESQFLADICRIIVDDGGYRLAWVGFVNDQNDSDESDRRVLPVAQRGYEDGYLESIEIRWDESEHGQGPTGTAIRTGAPTVVRNILADPSFAPWRDEAKERGFCSVIALPLTSEDETLGALTIYAS